MPRSSDRAQFEAVVALVAVFAVSTGLVIYADVLADVTPETIERASAETTLERVHGTLRVAGVTHPHRLKAAIENEPAGVAVNVTLQTDRGIWQRGPDPSSEAESARRRVSVRVGPGEIRPGRLTVVVWR